MVSIRNIAERIEDRKPTITAAEVHNVKEFSLVCSADADIWTDHLAQYGLRPTVKEGKAVLLISVTDLTFSGIPFKEFVISISVQNPDDSSEVDSAFLLTAYNSNPFFAWSEKNIFSTPFRRGDISYDTEKYSGAELFESGIPLVRLYHAPEPSGMFRVPRYEGHETWRGTVFFPDAFGTGRIPCKCFRVAVEGWGRKIEFRPENDSLVINAWNGNTILALLQESNIRGVEWFIRTNSFHSKSLTYRYTRMHKQTA